MAEGLSEMDDSLSETDSYVLSFDLPENEYTWLHCLPGDDPDLVVDVTSWLDIKPSFLTRDLTGEESPRTGNLIDTRTYTRPKKHGILGHGRTPQKHIVDDIINKNESPSSSKTPYASAHAKEVRTSSMKTELAKMRHNKENLDVSSNTNQSPRNDYKMTFKTKRPLSNESSLLENVSYPQSFFTDVTGSSEQTQILSSENSGQYQSLSDSTEEKTFQTALSELITGKPYSPELLSTVGGSSPETRDSFLPTLVSTPTSMKKAIIPHFQPTNQCRGLDRVQQKINFDDLDENLNNNVSDNLDETYVKPINHQASSFKSSHGEGSEEEGKLNRTVTISTNTVEEYAAHVAQLEKRESTFLILPSRKKNDNTLLDSEGNILPSREHQTSSMHSSKLRKAKPDEKESDSCYSSSSNVRSFGDICAIAQKQEESLELTNIRKSLSHDSLLSAPEANVKTCRKHESTFNLTTSNFGSGLMKPGFMFRTDIGGLKKQGVTPRFDVGGERMLHKPVISSKHEIETVSRLTHGVESKTLPSVKLPTLKLPVVTQSTLRGKEVKPSIPGKTKSVIPPTVKGMQMKPPSQKEKEEKPSSLKGKEEKPPSQQERENRPSGIKPPAVVSRIPRGKIFHHNVPTQIGFTVLEDV